MDKKALRREIGVKKSALTGREIGSRSLILAERLFATEQYRRAESLYAYLSFNQEVRTNPIIERAWADGKRVAVPKVAERIAPSSVRWESVAVAISVSALKT